MKAEVSKDRVLEAASKCPTAKETLKVLFPEFFEEDKSVSMPKFESIRSNCDRRLFEARNYGKYKDKGIWLNNNHFNWELIIDGTDELVLVPTKK